MPRKQDIELEDEEPPTIEPYKVLAIEKSATADEVKAAYRKAALKHHPGMCFTFILPHKLGPQICQKWPFL
jgi:DnaJ family protein C protein 9